MADWNQAINALAVRVASEKALIVAPSLGYSKTFFQIEPLIQALDEIATQILEQYPEPPVRILASSLGGLLWLEVLARNPAWWSRIESLILLGSPVGGAHLARIIDPLGWGIGIAKDLGVNRRSIAEQIAAVIPTLTIASDIGGGWDGTVTVECTKFKHAHFVCLQGITHPNLRIDSAVAQEIRSFWAETRQPHKREFDLSDEIIHRLRSVPGMTDGQLCFWGIPSKPYEFQRFNPEIVFHDRTCLWRLSNSLQIIHVFVADANGQCLYSGFVGWGHAEALKGAIDQIRQDFAEYIS